MYLNKPESQWNINRRQFNHHLRLQYFVRKGKSEMEHLPKTSKHITEVPYKSVHFIYTIYISGYNGWTSGSQWNSVHLACLELLHESIYHTYHPISCSSRVVFLYWCDKCPVCLSPNLLFYVPVVLKVKCLTTYYRNPMLIMSPSQVKATSRLQ